MNSVFCVLNLSVGLFNDENLVVLKKVWDVDLLILMFRVVIILGFFEKDNGMIKLEWDKYSKCVSCCMDIRNEVNFKF